MSIICNNGASICTPDNFAVKARKLRLKREMRSNLVKHQVRMNRLHNKRNELVSKAYTLAGLVFGLGYVLAFLTMPLGV